MNPKLVTPGNFELIKVIYTSPDGFFSIAIGIGDGGNIYESKDIRFAMRWNGKSEEQKGFPASNGHPLWFQLPNDISAIIKTLMENSDMTIKLG